MSDLTTLQSVKDWIGVTGTTDDALLQRLVSAVSVAAQIRMGRQVGLTSYTDMRNGTGRSAMPFPQSPAVSVTKVTVNGVDIPARTSPTGAGYAFDSQLIYLTGYTFTEGRQNVVLQYAAGFATTPFDIEQAVLEIVAHKYKGRQWIGQSSKTIGAETVAFLRDVPVDSLRVLDQYRRVTET